MTASSLSRMPGPPTFSTTPRIIERAASCLRLAQCCPRPVDPFEEARGRRVLQLGWIPLVQDLVQHVVRADGDDAPIERPGCCTFVGAENLAFAKATVCAHPCSI